MSPIEKKIQSHKKRIKRLKRMKMILGVSYKFLNTGAEIFANRQQVLIIKDRIPKKIEKKISALEEEMRIISIIKEEIQWLQVHE
ncbi:hypothetical protein [Leptospira bandrabouensis]|uniref:hypothetical protein n=1 Tax=Leptospira bandrabouensis TaxID=2484903 RepID=UPI001EE7D05E|nr:hypothetical protein [Leptospira bandrabouensis]MCG6144127.1 hypothetical protein [Leptospira bandrabouensis]MCG6159788.1 hypothetical protein [Leptospira bandrabouensis]MCG6163721.1 hypothetical protein [Leptospira bandrabouensis]